MGEDPCYWKDEMLKQVLHDNWTVRAVGERSEVPADVRDVVLPARVPGCVHTDLLRAGKIPDPYQDLNEHKLQWIGHTDWQYRTTVVADEQLFAHERIDLVFDGLDTVARIELNGRLVAETFNMHRGYRFDVRQSLKRGENELVVTFASPVGYAKRMEEKLHPRPYCNGPAGPFNFIRKMACNFGWDWGPGLPTSGIWRGVRVEGWKLARFDRVLTEVKSRDAVTVIVRATIEFSHRQFKQSTFTVRAELIRPDHRQVVATSEAVCDPETGMAELELKVPEPQRWNPVGHGEQPLYTLVLSLDEGSCIVATVDNWRARIGLRTVELDTSPDDIGSKFVIKVNGKPIFCKGFNWIPDDCFLDRATNPARVRQRIQQAADAGANMLRVWGGGIYETDEFYDICDELGVLVWQDFLFACAMYPEEEPFRSEVEAEARYNVARLAHHPSLALWNGCNENIWAYRDWGWGTHEDMKLPDGSKRTWGKGYYFDLLPRICKELTPTVPYWAGSPWSGDTDVDHGIPPNADTHGNMHVWRPWNHANYDSYREFQPRFASEFGFQAPATYASIASVVRPEDRDFGGPQMRHRQKSGDRVRDDGDRRNLRHVIDHFNIPGARELYEALESPDKSRKLPYCGGEPLHVAKSLPSKVNFDDLHYLMQVNQARALQFAVESFRSRQPRCMGTLYWQLNDCWPGVTSWSCIDGDGRKKPLWYATRNFFNSSIETIQIEADGALYYCFVNDSDQPRSGGPCATRYHFDGRELAKQAFGHADLPPRSINRVRLNPDVTTPGDPTREFIMGGYSAPWFFKLDKELNYPPARFDAEWQDGWLIVRPRTFIRDLCIFVDRLDPDATISNQLITLVPPEDEVRFKIEAKLPLTLEQLTTPPVFQCVNRFGAANAL